MVLSQSLPRALIAGAASGVRFASGGLVVELLPHAAIASAANRKGRTRVMRMGILVVGETVGVAQNSDTLAHDAKQKRRHGPGTCCLVRDLVWRPRTCRNDRRGGA